MPARPFTYQSPRLSGDIIFFQVQIPIGPGSSHSQQRIATSSSNLRAIIIRSEKPKAETSNQLSTNTLRKHHERTVTRCHNVQAPIITNLQGGISSELTAREGRRRSQRHRTCSCRAPCGSNRRYPNCIQSGGKVTGRSKAHLNKQNSTM